MQVLALGHVAHPGIADEQATQLVSELNEVQKDYLSTSRRG